jgi:hypothetical protein
MPKLLVLPRSFYSQIDEANFFRWLKSIGGVLSVTGYEAGLEVSLKSLKLSRSDLNELIAFHFRYGLPMKQLRIFKNARNSDWFENPSAYWFDKVFGANAISPDIEARLTELKALRRTPVQAIKTINKEYGLGLAESKRRFGISKAWLKVSKNNEKLVEQAIAILQNPSDEFRHNKLLKKSNKIGG